jgi:hypothetical protein
MSPSRRALAWSLGYLAVVVLCVVPIIVKAGKFAGIYAIVVTLPWSIIFFAALLLVEFWFHVRVVYDYAAGLGLLLLSALVNAAFIYRIVLNRAKVQP